MINTDPNPCLTRSPLSCHSLGRGSHAAATTALTRAPALRTPPSSRGCPLLPTPLSGTAYSTVSSGRTKGFLRFFYLLPYRPLGGTPLGLVCILCKLGWSKNSNLRVAGRYWRWKRPHRLALPWRAAEARLHLPTAVRFTKSRLEMPGSPRSHPVFCQHRSDRNDSEHRPLSATM